jgi:phospholipid-binding lipoprotein MlaA
MSRCTTVLLAILLANGCVSVPPERRVAHDPWEGPNRTLYNFNDGLDRVSLRPIARFYNKVLPQPVRQGVTNFSTNLYVPRSSINSFLQGKPRDGVSEILRFIINSTFGIGGLFDIASPNGLEPRNEDFGQTAAVWGIPQGPYVMLPFLGPQTLTDALLVPLDIGSDPLYYYKVRSYRDPITILRIINLRARLLPLEDILADSADPYVTVRESWLQNRQFEIYDGDPPVDEEEDDLFDEFFEDEEY